MNSVLHKITSSKVLTCDDLTSQDKEKLYTLMERLGASRAFTYDRFFKEGFRLWELIGVDSIKDFFLLSSAHKDLYDYLNVLRVDNRSEDGWFWTAISSEWGLRASLKAVMIQLGMLSEVTIQKRFSTDNWKEFERKGLISILSSFEPVNSFIDVKALFDVAWKSSLSSRNVKLK